MGRRAGPAVAGSFRPRAPYIGLAPRGLKHRATHGFRREFGRGMRPQWYLREPASTELGPPRSENETRLRVYLALADFVWPNFARMSGARNLAVSSPMT
jgi:hypothetical protein